VREVFALRPRVRLSTAVDGATGLAQALAEPPDLVLLDLQLPDMNGIEVLRRLRAQPVLAGCVVIALSADAMPEHIAAGRAAGFDDYWTKPIQFDRFLADIDRFAAALAAAPGNAAGPD
jgi:CheY-like chemotaxis protein